MTINYSPLLQLAEPVTGTESGVWGDVVNQQVTLLVEAAIAGASTITFTSTDVTLTTTTGSGGNQSRSAILLLAGSPASPYNLIGPGTSKIYLVKNSTGQTITFKASGTTGVAITNGSVRFVYWNGSDYAFADPVGGATTQVQYNSSGALAGSANLTFDGTTLTAAQFKDSALTSGRVTYATTSGQLTDSSNLTFNGTTLTAAGLAGPFNGTVGATTQNNGYFTGFRLYGASSGYVGFQGAAAAGSTVYTLPAADGTTGQSLTTNGSGTLSWASGSGGISTGKAIAMAIVFG